MHLCDGTSCNSVYKVYVALFTTKGKRKVQGVPQSQKKTWEKSPGRATFTKKGKRKVQGVPQTQTAALPRHQEEGETDKSKQVQIKQTYEKH